MSHIITHLAAIAMGVLVTLLLVRGYNNATATPAVSRKKEATVTTTAAKGGNDNNNNQKKKKKNRNKNSKKKPAAAAAVAAATVESEDDDEEDNDGDVDEPIAFSKAELDVFKEEDKKKKKKTPQQKKKKNKKKKKNNNTANRNSSAAPVAVDTVTPLATKPKPFMPTPYVQPLQARIVEEEVWVSVPIKKKKKKKKIRRDTTAMGALGDANGGAAAMVPLDGSRDGIFIGPKNATMTDIHERTGTLMALPKTVRIYILSFLGETQEELRELPLVSKQFDKDCKEPGLGWKLIPVFVLSAKDNNEDNGRTLNFIHTMNQFQQDKETHRKLQRYTIFKVENMEQFDHVPDDELFRNNNIEGNLVGLPYEKMPQMNMKGIRSLEMSSLPSLTTVSMDYSLSRALSRMMPNLHDLNLSHTNFNASFLHIFSIHCNNLEKFAWTNINIESDFNLDGGHMKIARNIKEFNMDNSNFSIYFEEDLQMSDLNNHPTMFIFYECDSTVLERVSIRNAKYHTYNNTTGSVSQNMLIKFIRNAPATLKWFRSDLTQENIEMLTKERPGIQLLN